MPGSGGGSSLARQLDREIHQVIRKLLDDQSSPLLPLRVSNVYNTIMSSNSSLKRKPKKLLEDSIERVLDTFEEEATGSDSQEEREFNRLTNVEVEEDLSNAMNRSIVNSWTHNKKEPKNSHRTSTTITAEPKDEMTSARLETNSKKRNEQSPDENRVHKRSKQSSKRVDPAIYRAPDNVSLEDIGGMEATIEKLDELLVQPLFNPKRYIDNGVNIPRGILFHGPPGCGKTMLCEAIAASLSVPFQYVSAPSIVSGISGDSEKALREKFNTAIQIAPSIMFIDEIDAITPKRESAQREMDRRIVGQLLTCMDNLALEKTDGKSVIVLAATNRPDSLDPALRRAGRFDVELNIDIPNIEAREAILRLMTRKIKTISPDIDFKKLAKSTSGYVGADLQGLVTTAWNMLQKRYIKMIHERYGSQVQNMDIDSGIQLPMSTAAERIHRHRAIAASQVVPEVLEDFEDTITMDDFMQAVKIVQPSAKREGFATVPDTTWADIGALKGVRKQLQQLLVDPIASPELFEMLGLHTPSGVLLWGPPGCGKTLLVKAVANESSANFISIKGPELLNQYVGETERAIRQVFFRARAAAPCILFFDEFDGIVPKRNDRQNEASTRVVNQLLTELDGVDSRTGVYVVAATNRPDQIDPAVLRSGRLGEHLFVGVPGREERVEILQALLRRKVCEAGIAQKIAGSNACAGFSGADLNQLLMKAGGNTVRRRGKEINLEDFRKALLEVRPSVTSFEVQRFESLKRTLTSDS